MSAVRTPEIVTLDNLREVSRQRSLAYGITLMLMGIGEFAWFGSPDSSLGTTIQFGANSATVLPALSSVWRVVFLLIGIVVSLVSFAPASRRPSFVRRVPRAARIAAGLLGLYFIAWPIGLWTGANVDGQLAPLTFNNQWTGWAIGLGTFLLGGVLAWRRWDRGASFSLYVGLLVFLLGFLIWVTRGSNVSGLNLQMGNLIASAIMASTALIFGSLSGTLCERAGVVNIAIEGQFMMGALFGVMFASAFNGTGVSKTFAVLIAGLAGGLFGWVLAVMALRYRADQVIVGVVIVAFCTSMTDYLSSGVLNTSPQLNQAISLPVWPVPFFSHIPVIGPALFDQNVLLYVAILAIIAANVALFRTRWGLRVRSVGEKPLASETVGINVIRMRYGAVILGGFVAGIGGAAFTLGTGTGFEFGMTNGYGYIALAIMIFGRWRPYGAMAASLLFGFTIAISANLGLYLQQLIIPQQFISALPYVITIAVVAGLVGRIRPPAADGVPFSRH